MPPLDGPACLSYFSGSRMESWKDCKPGRVWLWDEEEGGFEPVTFRTMVVSLCRDQWHYYLLSFFLIFLRLALERV